MTTDDYVRADDGEYEVTAEMLIHGEVDDEQTLEEEEALQCREEVEEEVDDLQKVWDCVGVRIVRVGVVWVRVVRVGLWKWGL